MKKVSDMPLVSVVMPCYNHEEYVAESIESVLNQTYPNIEFLVLDNGSIDNSYNVIKKYSDKITKIFHLDENNFFRANEILRSNCSGEYIALMTSDDLWEEQKIEKQIKVFQENPKVKACFTWAEMVDSDGDIIAVADNSMFTEHNMTRYQWLERIILRGNCLAYPSAVIEKTVLLKVCENLPALWQLQDMYIWLSILLEHDIHVIEEGLVKFVWHVKGENRNTSASSPETAIRTYNENVFIISKIIGEMEENLFVKVFNKYLCNSEAEMHNDILCEKFFLLQKIGESNIGIQNEALSFYFNNNLYLKGVGYSLQECLQEKYKYSLDDFLKYCASHGNGVLHMLSMDIQNKEKKHQMLLNKINNMDKLCKYQKEIISRQSIRLDVLNEVSVLDLNIDDRQKMIRRKMFGRLPNETRHLASLILRYLENMFLCIEESSDIELENSINHLIESTCSIENGLNRLWEELLSMDNCITVDEWRNGMDKITADNVGSSEFCENILPFLTKIYSLLQQYMEDK